MYIYIIYSIYKNIARKLIVISKHSIHRAESSSNSKHTKYLLIRYSTHAASSAFSKGPPSRVVESAKPLVAPHRRHSHVTQVEMTQSASQPGSTAQLGAAEPVERGASTGSSLRVPQSSLLVPGLPRAPQATAAAPSCRANRMHARQR